MDSVKPADRGGERGGDLHLAAKASAVLLLAFALLLRIYALDRYPGMHGDETWYANQAAGLILGTGFETRTPMGVILNPFYTGLLAVLQAPLPFSYWVVRLAALISGVAFLVVLRLVTRRLFPRDLAVVVLLLGAALPFTIAYSRFGWDSSQTPLATLLVISCALSRRWLLTSLALAAALIVHPTNIFLLPVALAPYLVVTSGEGDRWRYRPALFLGLCAFIAGGTLGVLFLFSPTTFEDMTTLLVQRLTTPSDLALFLVEYVRLLTGTTVFQHLCGSGYRWPNLVVDVVAGGLIYSALLLGGRRLLARDERAAIAYLTGLGLALVGFYLVGGLPSIQPVYERYAASLVVPSLFAVGVLGQVLTGTPGARRALVLGGHVAAWLLTISFAANYYGVLSSTGGEAEFTLRTAERDPKQMAYDLILEDAGPGARVLVLASGWWDGQPLRYLSHAEDTVEVRFSTIESQTTQPPDDGASHVYAVAFAGQEYDLRLTQALAHRGKRRWLIDDRAGRPLLRVYRLRHPGHPDM